MTTKRSPTQLQFVKKSNAERDLLQDLIPIREIDSTVLLLNRKGVEVGMRSVWEDSRKRTRVNSENKSKTKENSEIPSRFVRK